LLGLGLAREKEGEAQVTSLVISLYSIHFSSTRKTWRKRKARVEMRFGRDEDTYRVLDLCPI
jgi:hypothetical protein